MDWCRWKSLGGWKRIKYKELDQDYHDDDDENDKGDPGDSDRRGRFFFFSFFFLRLV